LAVAGISYPNSAPATIATRVQVVNDLFLMAYTTRTKTLRRRNNNNIDEFISTKLLAWRTNKIRVTEIILIRIYGKFFQSLIIVNFFFA